MVILSNGGNEIEVRIIKYPLDEGDYFEEYVKLGERDTATALQTRYITAEDDLPYAIEIVLKEGFVFGDYTKVRA
jgi:hypothetical protein